MKSDKNPQNKKKKVKIDITDMGVNIDQDEYKDILLSQSNHPEKFH